MIEIYFAIRVYVLIAMLVALGICGIILDAHNGACDGCHWKDEWREAIDAEHKDD